MATTIVDAINAQARVLKKVVSVLQEQDAIIKPGARPLDILNGINMDELEVMTGEMINPEEPLVTP